MKGFQESDRFPLKGTVQLKNGTILDVTGAILSEESNASVKEPVTKSRQCRIFYYKMPNGNFLIRQKIPKSNPTKYSYSLCAISKTKLCEKANGKENNFAISFLIDSDML